MIVRVQIKHSFLEVLIFLHAGHHSKLNGCRMQIIVRTLPYMRGVIGAVCSQGLEAAGALKPWKLCPHSQESCSGSCLTLLLRMIRGNTVSRAQQHGADCGANSSLMNYPLPQLSQSSGFQRRWFGSSFLLSAF